MEEGVATVAFGTGMGAIAATMLALLRAGDHVVSSSYLFGNTNSLFHTFEQIGVAVTFVDATDVANVEAAITPARAWCFVETIANPRTQVADLARIGELCTAARRRLLRRQHDDLAVSLPAEAVGASLVINSLTKCIGGHGNALGGAVTDTGLYDWSRYPNVYDSYKKGASVRLGDPADSQERTARRRRVARTRSRAPASLSARRRWRCGWSAACANALKLATHLEAHPKVARVYYPGLESHPQHGLAKALFRSAGGLFAFELVPEAGLLRLPRQARDGRMLEPSRRYAHARDSGRAYDLLRDGRGSAARAWGSPIRSFESRQGSRTSRT